jgi:hypothetical protein
MNQQTEIKHPEVSDSSCHRRGGSISKYAKVWKEQNYGYGSQQGLKPRMTVLQGPAEINKSQPASRLPSSKDVRREATT